MRIGFRGAVVFCFLLIQTESWGGLELKVNGTEYISLKEVAGKLGLKRDWIQRRKRMLLQSKWTRMEFEVHQRDIRINKVRVFLGFPVTYHRSDLYISRLDLKDTIYPILTPQIGLSVPDLKRIAIDAGHGGKDPGTQNAKLGLLEKHLVLDVSRRLGLILQRKGYEVVYTREQDRYVGLTDRAHNTNRRGADLFLSIHFNGIDSPRVAGSETYVFTPRNQPSTRNKSVGSSARKYYAGNENNNWSTLIAFYVQDEMIRQLGTVDRGVKRARWTVLRDLTCPGIMVEAGFITNPTEGRRIKTAAYRQKIAEVVSEGVLRYHKTLVRLRKR